MAPQTRLFPRSIVKVCAHCEMPFLTFRSYEQAMSWPLCAVLVRKIKYAAE